MTPENSRRMLYTSLPTEDDPGFRKPVPTLTGFTDDEPDTPTDPTHDAPSPEPTRTSRPTSTQRPSAWSGTLADD